MTQEQYLKNLTIPEGRIDVILDTDAYNEIDDQFAIAYMVRNRQKFHIKGICAAPFLNAKVGSAGEGMRRSCEEIFHILTLTGCENVKPLVRCGSEHFLCDEVTPTDSDAADFMAALAKEYTAQKPLYIVALGAITNVASAILKNPDMKESCVVVWLGGHGTHIPLAASEFNMRQDIAAARVVLGCGIPVVLLPCAGVVDHFSTSKYELLHWLKGKNALCDYLCENTIRAAEAYAAGKPWTRVIWDVTAVAWLLNEDARFMRDKLIPSPIPQYDKHYAFDDRRHFIRYIYSVNRDALFQNLFEALEG